MLLFRNAFVAFALHMDVICPIRLLIICDIGTTIIHLLHVYLLQPCITIAITTTIATLVLLLKSQHSYHKHRYDKLFINTMNSYFKSFI